MLLPALKEEPNILLLRGGLPAGVVEGCVRWEGGLPAGVVDGACEMELLPLRLGVDGDFAPKLKLKAILAVFAVLLGCCNATVLSQSRGEVAIEVRVSTLIYPLRACLQGPSRRSLSQLVALVHSYRGAVRKRVDHGMAYPNYHGKCERVDQQERP